MHALKKLTTSFVIVAMVTVPLLGQKKSPVSVEVKKTSELTDPTTQSITYTLPKTAIKIIVETEKTTKIAGPYYRYSQRFLNLSEVITENSEEWKIAKVHFSTYGVPDEEQRYSIISKGTTSALNVSLTKDGVLAGINLSPHPFHKKDGLKNKRVGKLQSFGFDDVPLHEDLLYKTSTTAMAQEAANMIYKIRNNRIDLLSGEMENLPPDGDAYQKVLDELDKMEKEFVSLFAGKTVKEKKIQYFIVTPDPLSSYNNHVICRFSKQKGIVDAMDISGTPIYFKLDPETKAKLVDNTVEAPKVPLKNGLYYYLPGKAKVSVVDKNREVASQTITFAQYGQVISMPASVLVNENKSIMICPITGALISINN